MEYTSEQLNFFRVCYIAFNLVPEGLRKVFKREWDFLYKTTPLGEWKDTAKNGFDFYNNESRRSRANNTRCLATIQKGNTAEWDCTCLVFAILYSNSVGTTLSTAVRSDIDDLRQLRNGVAHISEAKLTDVEFQNCIGKAIAAFKSLKLPISEVEEVKNQISFRTAEVTNLMTQLANLQADLQLAQDTAQKKEEEVEALTQEINSKVESFCELASKPSHEIIRRSKDVMRIMKKMEELEERSTGVVSTVYLSGNPGCGKSQIARQLGEEYFYKRSRESKGLICVATMNVGTLETLADSYLSLAKQLEVTEYTLTSLAKLKVESPKETIQHLKRLIAPKMKQFSTWLIIADNVLNLSLVQADLPPTGSKDWGHGQVLITTQDSSTIPFNAPHTFHESLSQGMQPHDAVELLRQVSQIANQEQAGKAAEVLEYQPLALAAAAVYVQTVVSNGSPTYSWADYLERFSRGEREATEESLTKQNSAYSTSMTTAIKMAIARASEGDEVLRQVFCFLSLCASDSLPIEAVVDFVKGHAPDQTEELITAKILTSSLITCLHGDDGNPCYLRVHNIIHEVLKTVFRTQDDLTEIVQSISAAIKTFHSLIEAEQKLLKGSGHACAKLRKMIVHCKALHEIITTNVAVRDVLVKELTHSVTNGNVVSWLCSASHICCDLGYPHNANLFSNSACNFVKHTTSTKKGELLKADVFFMRGKVLNLQYEYKLAISHIEMARTIYREIYGEEHADEAGCYNYLGNVYIRIGQYKKAKEFHEKALIIRKRIYGEEHVEVVGSFNNLGTDYRKLGQHKRAKECHEKALRIGSKIYGDQHVYAAAIYNNLAVVNFELGNHNEAKECNEKALSIRKKIYGEDHPDVALSYYNLALGYGELGQHNHAQECDMKALSIRKKIYGEEHPDVATSYHSMGVNFRELGQHNQAKECDEKALNIRKKIYRKAEHPDVAASYHNLGVDYRQLGQHNEAKECSKKALIIRKKIYGEGSLKVAKSYHNLAFDYWELGQHNQAKECNENALNIRKKICGEDHPDVATSYLSLVVNYRELGQHNEAKKCNKKALSIRKKIYGEEHPDVAESFHNLAVDYRELGKLNQAKECDQKALHIRKRVYGEDHPEVAKSYNNMGVDYSMLRQHNKAKESNEKALNIRTKTCGEGHPDVAKSCNNLGVDYSELGLYKEARECHETALMIRKKFYGEQHAKVKQSYENLRVVNRHLTQCNEVKKERCVVFYSEER